MEWLQIRVVDTEVGLMKSIPIGCCRRVDGSANSADLLTHFVCMNITVNAHTSSINMLVTNLRLKSLILGLSWLKKVNPLINWKLREMEILSNPNQFSTLR